MPTLQEQKDLFNVGVDLVRKEVLLATELADKDTMALALMLAGMSAEIMKAQTGIIVIAAKPGLEEQAVASLKKETLRSIDEARILAQGRLQERAEGVTDND